MKRSYCNGIGWALAGMKWVPNTFIGNLVSLFQQAPLEKGG